MSVKCPQWGGLEHGPYKYICSQTQQHGPQTDLIEKRWRLFLCWGGKICRVTVTQILLTYSQRYSLLFQWLSLAYTNLHLRTNIKLQPNSWLWCATILCNKANLWQHSCTQVLHKPQGKSQTWRLTSNQICSPSNHIVTNYKLRAEPCKSRFISLSGRTLKVHYLDSSLFRYVMHTTCFSSPKVFLDY